MTKLINDHVVFCIDDGHKLYEHYKFVKHLATLKALDELVYEPKLCVGMWENQMENSFMMDYNDYYKFIDGEHWAAKQDCIMIMNPVNPRSTSRFQATFRSRYGHEADDFGGELTTKDYSEIVRDKDDNWTAILGTNIFYVFK